MKIQYLLVLAMFSAIPMNLLQSHDEDIHDTRSITKKLVSAHPEDVVQNLTPVKAEAPATIGHSPLIGQGAIENSAPFSRVSNVSNPSRYREIKVDPKTAAHEIDFWARQMSEHALFAHLGLEDPDLKQAALETHQAFEDFRSQFNEDPTDEEHMGTILPLLQKERAFQIMVLKAMEAGKWVGWIFPLFLNHITLELDYFVDKLNGIPYTPEEEVLFWNRINSEHAAFAAHLLDPSERELFLKADEMSVKFMNIPRSEKEMMLRISLNASKQLDEFNKTAQAAGKTVKSIIHPVLLAHVIREGERSIQTLSKLGLHTEAEQFKSLYKDQISQYNEC